MYIYSTSLTQVYVHGQEMKMIRDEWKLPTTYNNYSYNPLWNHLQLQPLSDYGGNKRTRWNPTAEQLQALQHMYQSGITTPSAQLIQQIAAKLRKFGKIEGKNVFYWFQNHKARDKRRAKFHHPNPNPPGLSKRPRLETEHPNKFPTTSLKSMHGGVDQELKGRGPDDENAHAFNFCKMLGAKNDNFRDLGPGIKENKTLELFPIKSIEEEESVDHNSSCRVVPNQFIEFLPTKKY